MRDFDENVVTVILKKNLSPYKMSHETCQELVEISVVFENSLRLYFEMNVSGGADGSKESLVEF